MHQAEVPRVRHREAASPGEPLHRLSQPGARNRRSLLSNFLQYLSPKKGLSAFIAEKKPAFKTTPALSAQNKGITKALRTERNSVSCGNLRSHTKSFHCNPRNLVSPTGCVHPHPRGSWLLSRQDSFPSGALPLNLSFLAGQCPCHPGTLSHLCAPTQQ